MCPQSSSLVLVPLVCPTHGSSENLSGPGTGPVSVQVLVVLVLLIDPSPGPVAWLLKYLYKKNRKTSHMVKKRFHLEYVLLNFKLLLFTTPYTIFGPGPGTRPGTSPGTSLRPKLVQVLGPGPGPVFISGPSLGPSPGPGKISGPITQC